MQVELRDYFAAKAMHGLLADGQFNHYTAAKLADYAYGIANAMLAVRESSKPKHPSGWNANGEMASGSTGCTAHHLGNYDPTVMPYD